MRASDFLTEFDASDYKQRYTLYTGDEYNTYKVDTFSDLDAAIEEVSFLRDADPSTLTSYWQIRDINDRVVWNYDPGEAYDTMRGGNKIQFRKPDELNESTFREHEAQLRDFIKWCVKKLKIKQALPKIRFQDAKEGPDQHRTGYYDDNDDIMWIYTGNRNLIDIMRTVAHELAHRKQHEDNMVHGNQAYPGSPIEQEADAVAGYLMKLYGRENPEIIE